MAINPDRPFFSGVRVSSDALRLLALRVFSLLLLLAPAELTLRSGMLEGLGRNPLADPAQGLQASLLLDTLGDLPGAWLPLVALGGLLFIFWDQLLTAGALTRLDPFAERAPSQGLWRSLWDDSARHFWPMLRIFAVSVFVVAIGALVVTKVFSPTVSSAQANGWTAQTRFVVLPLLQAGAIILWTAFVGSWAWLAKSLTVLCQRRRVRRTLWDATKMLWRRPLAWVLPFISITLTAQFLGALLLTALYPPSNSAAGLSVWLLYLLAHGFVWVWVTGAAPTLLNPARRAEFGSQRDEPFSIEQSIARRLRRFGKRG